MDFLKIESSYYSFLIDDVKFIVLNTCYIRDGQKCVPFLKRNYDKTKQAYPWLPQVEADWLLQELESDVYKRQAHNMCLCWSLVLWMMWKEHWQS